MRPRILSLLPSATEIVCLLGLRDQLVGVSHECDWPSDVLGLPVVTRARLPPDATSKQIDRLVREQLRHGRALYALDIDSVEQLQPDIIVTQSVCHVCAVAESEVERAINRLSKRPRIVNLEPASLWDVFDAIRVVAEAVDVRSRAETVIAGLEARVHAVVQRTGKRSAGRRVVMLEWIDPLFSAGHWTPELIRLAGGRECIGREGEASKTIQWSEVVAANPEVLAIACCGYSLDRLRVDMPILQALPEFDTLTCVRDGNVFLFDGNAYFNRPGPRLVDALEVLAHSLHPELHPLPGQLNAPEYWSRFISC